MKERSKSLSPFERMRLKVGRQMTQTLLRRPLSIELPRGLVSFTFDDFPASAYRIGGAILLRHSVRGTYYAAFGLLGSDSEGQTMMTQADVTALLAEGHELGCHTYSHISCRGLASYRLQRELNANLAALEEVNGQTSWDSFSYPFGDITLAAKRVVRDRFATCRGRRAGLNQNTIDLAALRSDSLYSRTDPVERTLEQIEEAARRRGWLIFCTHDVAAAPSSFGCTPEHLESAVAAAIQAGCDVVTVGEAALRLGVPSGSGKPPLSAQ